MMPDGRISSVVSVVNNRDENKVIRNHFEIISKLIGSLTVEVEKTPQLRLASIQKPILKFGIGRSTIQIDESPEGC